MGDWEISSRDTNYAGGSEDESFTLGGHGIVVVVEFSMSAQNVFRAFVYIELAYDNLGI